MAEKIHAIIFDMGGVIIQTRDDSPRVALAKKLGVPLDELINEVFSSESALKSEKGEITKHEHWKNVLHSFRIDHIQDIVSIDEAFWGGDCIDKEVMDYIYALKQNYRVGLLSNAFKGARAWLDRQFHFLDAFHVTVFSYEVKLRKPDPRIYQLICERMGVKPKEAVFIDDLMVNVEGARNAGLLAIQYKNKSQLRRDLSETLTK